MFVCVVGVGDLWGQGGGVRVVVWGGDVRNIKNAPKANRLKVPLRISALFIVPLTLFDSDLFSLFNFFFFFPCLLI